MTTAKRATLIDGLNQPMFTISLPADSAIPAVWDLARHERIKAYERQDEDRIALADAVLLAIAEMWPSHIPFDSETQFKTSVY